MPAAGSLLDTGPLVAYLYSRDAHHRWAVEQFEAVAGPFHTCEAVLTEACFLLARNRLSAVRVLELCRRGVIRISLGLDAELASIESSMRRYASVPMSLADACLVRMAEMTGLPICTLDTDFAIYRAHGRQPLELISPAGSYGFHEAEGEGDPR